ncbi:MAG: DUF2079 domain-containing protein [Acidimicrobiia bacterium]|nr:DUF2079 domain-containing protein [Acidimicrobiia bacterium]
MGDETASESGEDPEVTPVPEAGLPGSDQTEPRSPGESAFDPVRLTLLAMVVAWSVLFILLTSLRHDRFGTFGFDLGIYDQGIWLTSRLHDPFVTVRGIDLYGHHFNVVFLLFAPFYWLGAGPHFLLAVQVVAQASGAVAVYLLARDRFDGARWLAVAMAAVLLLNPTYQYLAWEFFHPDALSIAPLLFAYWAAREKRWGWFAVAGSLAIICKEDVALALFVIGALVWFRGDRRIGALVAGLSAAWFMLATRVFIPAFNGIGPFYDSFFGEFGDGPGEVVKNVLTRPGQVWETATRQDRTSYYWRMGAPFAFVFLAAPRALLVGAPMFAVNVLTSFPYARDPRFHYASLVLVGITVATVEAIAALGRDSATRGFLVGVVLAASLATSILWGAAPWSVDYDRGIWPLRTDARNEVKAEAVDLIPTRAPTSAIYNLVPHLTHRDRIYEFPVPWCNVNWGVRGENLDDPAGVEWIAVDVNLLGAADRRLLDDLLEREFEVRLDSEGILVAERVSPTGDPAVACLSAGG